MQFHDMNIADAIRNRSEFRSDHLHNPSLAGREIKSGCVVGEKRASQKTTATAPTTKNLI